MPASAFHKRQLAKIAATLDSPRQPKRWKKAFKPDELSQAVLATKDAPAFEIKSFVPLSPQSSLTTNDGWEYQENGYSYSNRPH